MIFLSGPFRTLEPRKRPRIDVSAAHYSWDRWFWRPRPIDGLAEPTHSERPGRPGRNSSPPGAPLPPCGWRARRAAARAPLATQRLPCCCRSRRERPWERKCPASREAEAEVPGRTKAAADARFWRLAEVGGAVFTLFSLLVPESCPRRQSCRSC